MSLAEDVTILSRTGVFPGDGVFIGLQGQPTRASLTPVRVYVPPMGRAEEVL
jgi:hypothetical protein